MPQLFPEKEWRSSAPCRADLGGTLDLPLFYHTMKSGLASTFNMALSLRTELVLKPFERGKTAIFSKGFEPAVFPNGKAPYDHPLGLVFAILDTFGAGDLSLEIHSASPPRSSLGGSSVLAVALVALLMGMAGELSPGEPDEEEKAKITLTAWRIESAVTRVLGGLQDYLAAAFGGVHLWNWHAGEPRFPWRKTELFGRKEYPKLSSSFLLAFCGAPHDSIDSNERSIRGYLSGESRKDWERIACLTREFGNALSSWDMGKAIACMEEELDFRLRETPSVLDDAGCEFVRLARIFSCGARFTGAGGGGCVWALGPEERIVKLREAWKEAAKGFSGACILHAQPERQGVQISARSLEVEAKRPILIK